MNDLAKAQETFEALVEVNPEDAQTRIQLGEVYATRRSWTEALEQFRKVVELEPMNLAGLLNLGRACYEIREFQCAEDALVRAASLDPDNRYAHVNLGRVYYESARYDKAVTVLRHVVELAPADARAWFMLGEALIREGRSIPEAIEAFEEGLSLDPNYVDGHITLGDLYVRTGDAGSAIREFELALRLNPQLESQLRSRIDDLRRRTQN